MAFNKLLETRIKHLLSKPWQIRNGYKAPTTDTVALSDGGVQLDAAFLYADLANSSKIATEIDRKAAAKTFKAFLRVTSMLIKKHSGSITSFDGDRVMGVFVGKRKCSRAAICGLQINWAVNDILDPRLNSYFKSLRESELEISHCVGIDSGKVLSVRGGIRGSNDLVWVGRAPNLAAKLSDVRNPDIRTCISTTVFNSLADDAKYGGDPKSLMWKKYTHNWADKAIYVYGSSWWWVP